MLMVAVAQLGGTTCKVHLPVEAHIADKLGLVSYALVPPTWSNMSTGYIEKANMKFIALIY